MLRAAKRIVKNLRAKGVCALSFQQLDAKLQAISHYESSKLGCKMEEYFKARSHEKPWPAISLPIVPSKICNKIANSPMYTRFCTTAIVPQQKNGNHAEKRCIRHYYQIISGSRLQYYLQPLKTPFSKRFPTNVNV